MTTSVSATNGSVAVGSIQVGGDVSGDIIIGHHNFKVNTNYGTIVYNAPTEPVIQRRPANPQPPRPPLDFFDRTAELAQLEQLIAQGKPAVLYGPDGAGKSALLRQAAHSQAVQALPDGAILLEGLDEGGYTLLPGDLTQRWFDAFYLSQPPLKVTLASAQPYLSSLRPLLLLDNLTLDADQLRPLLDLFPNSPALIARALALPGLARPVRLGPLPHSAGMDLFAAASGLVVDEANRAALDALCALLNDVPLAIVRVADLVRELNLPLDQAQARLSAAPAVEGDPITSGLSRAVALIQSLLTPLEKQVLGAVANLPGVSIDPDTIAGILGGDLQAGSGGQISVEGEWVIVGGVRIKRRPGAAPETPGASGQPAAAPEPAAIGLAIEHLKALGLLHANSPRLRLDGGLRPLLGGLGDAGAIKDGLLARLLFDQLNGRFNDDAYCAGELGNVVGAIEHAIQTRQWNAAIVLSRAIDRYLVLNGLWEAWGQVANWVLQGARAGGDRSAEAWALHQLGSRAISADKAQAIDLLKQALNLRQSIGETTAAAYTQHNLDILIPPPVPPHSGEKPPGPQGLSAVARVVIGLVSVGVIAVAAITQPWQLLQPTPPPTLVPTTIPTAIPATITVPVLAPASTFTDTPAPATPQPTRTPTASITPAPAQLPWSIVFFSGPDPRSGYEVFSMNWDGSHRTQVTKGLREQVVTQCMLPVGAASLSPDRKQVAYLQYVQTTSPGVTSESALLYLKDVGAADPAAAIKLGSASVPRWSPDSSMLAVTLYGSNPATIQVFARTGKLLSRIALKQSPAIQAGQVSLSWSPDSKRIAFIDGSSIFAADVNGSNRVQLTRSEQAYFADFPGWSANGKWIAFVSGGEIHIMYSDGTPFHAFPAEGYDFAWSPDSAQLAFAEGHNIFTLDIDSGEVRNLAEQPGFLYGPVWSPDGGQIAFTAVHPTASTNFNDFLLEGPGRAASSAIYVVNADGSGLRDLTGNPDQNDFISYPHTCPS